MNDEYQLFKNLCHNQSVEITEQNLSAIESLKQKGLNLSCVDDLCDLNDVIQPLSEDSIRSYLNSVQNNFIEPLEIIFQSHSTNKQIATSESKQKYAVLLAEYQSNGQGRREKKWVSPLASNIYLSIKFSLTNNQNAHFIPLITALSVCKALDKLNIHGCMIKWPNDIYLNGKKLGGILVESRINRNKEQEIIVGIGLNVNMEINHEIDQLWTSLINENCGYKDRNIIIASLLSETLDNYNQLKQFNFMDFIKDWSQKDFLKGKLIKIMEENNTYHAYAKGIADDGALLVISENDEFQTKVYSAEVSVKAID